MHLQSFPQRLTWLGPHTSARHLQCFGLGAYLESNMKMRALNNRPASRFGRLWSVEHSRCRWTCPVCSNILKPHDLVVGCSKRQSSFHTAHAPLVLRDFQLLDECRGDAKDTCMHCNLRHLIVLVPRMSATCTKCNSIETCRCRVCEYRQAGLCGCAPWVQVLVPCRASRTCDRNVTRGQQITVTCCAFCKG